MLLLPPDDDADVEAGAMYLQMQSSKDRPGLPGCVVDHSKANTKEEVV